MDEMDAEPTMLQSQQRSKEELASLLAERLARKKALNSAVYVDPSTPSINVSADAASKTKGLMICSPLNKPPAAFFDEAREEVSAAVQNMFCRYSPAAGKSSPDEKFEDDSAREGAEETSDDNNPNQDVRNWISVAAAQNSDFASLLAYVPSSRSGNNNNNNTSSSRTVTNDAAAAAAAATHRRSTSSASCTSSVSCASSATDSTLSSLQAPDMLDEMEWWIPGFDKDKFRTLVDELKKQEGDVKEENESENQHSSDVGKAVSLPEESTSVNDESVQCETALGPTLEARTLSLTEESLTDVFDGLECESTTATDQDNAANQYGTFSLTESIASPGNTFDSAVGCAPTEEMDNTVVVIDQERSAAADTVGHGSTLAYYERVVQAPTTSDGSSTGTSHGGHQTATVITESHAPNDGGIAIECKFDPKTEVGAALDAADDAVNWEAEVIEARRVKEELQDKLQKMREYEVAQLEEWKEKEEEKKMMGEEREGSNDSLSDDVEIKQDENTLQQEDEEKVAATKQYLLRGTAHIKKFTPKSSKSVSSSISKLKTKIGRKKQTKQDVINAEESKVNYFFLERNNCQ